MIKGVSMPWNLALTTALGIWLLFASAIFSSAKSSADSDHIIGAFMIVISIIAMAEVVRSARYLLLILGAWLLFGSWLLIGAVAGAIWNDIGIGIAAILLALPQGRIKDTCGKWRN